MTSTRCRYILAHYRELWELCHWPISSNWTRRVGRRDHTHQPTHESLACDLADIQRAIAQLPDQRLAAAALMRWWLRLPCPEIAASLGASTSTIYRMLDQARWQIARAVADRP